MVLTGIVIAFWDLFLKFMLDGKRMPILKNIVSVYSRHNTGGAWSILSNATWLLIVISAIFLVGLIVFHFLLKKDKKSYVYALGMGLLIGGAICNFADRIRLGHVRDFIKLEFIDFPIFNIADMGITAGVVLLCVHFLILLPKKEKKLKEESLNGVQSENNNENSEESLKEINENINQQENLENKENIKKNKVKPKISKKENNDDNVNGESND